MFPVEHETPSHNVVQQGFHFVGDLKLGANGSAHLNEVNLLRRGYVS